jgi:tetratricopeptide (TPR) repeat protein
MNRLLREPFKSIRPRANENPASIGLGSGQAPPVGDTKDDDPVLNDFAAIEQQVSSLIELKRYSAAEQLLRESVDADPLDVKRRRALIDFLKQYAPVEVATRAIYGAADALGVGEFTTEVADLMLVAGRTEEAKILVNDAILTNPNDPLTRLLAAELRMREAHPDQAIKHIEAAFAKELTPFAFLMRATCRALNGSDDGAKLDVSRAKEGDSNVLAKNFARISGIIDDYFSISGAELRALFQKVNLNPDSAEVSDLIGKFDRQAKGCMLLIGEDAADMRFSKSHNLRVLALNLLVQTVTELRAYVNKPDQEVLTEARIDLGEFLKVLADARTEFERERKNERYSGTYWALWCGCGGSVHADKTICV